MDPGVIAVVFGVIFLSELPDKSMVVSLVLSTRYRPLYVWCGAAAAFLTHVLIAVTAGKLLTLLPHRIVEAIVALLFLTGAALLLFHHEKEDTADIKAQLAKPKHGFLKVFGTAFGMIFLGEWGDITQIAIANYAAHYHNPLSVAIGAVFALWAVTAVAVTVGKKVLKRLPAHLLHRITAAILLIFAVISAYNAIR